MSPEEYHDLTENGSKVFVPFYMRINQPRRIE